MISDVLFDAIVSIRGYLDDPRLGSYYDEATRKEIELGLTAMENLACRAMTGQELPSDAPREEPSAEKE